jgi:hypothetical protein
MPWHASNNLEKNIWNIIIWSAHRNKNNLFVDAFSERQILKKNRRRRSLVRRGRSAAWGRTVRDLAWGGGALRSSADGPRHRAGRSATWCRSSGSLPDDRTVRALGPDGPRPGAGARVPCLTTGRSAPEGRTVRAYAGAAEDRRRRLDLAPGRDPVGEERS